MANRCTPLGLNESMLLKLIEKCCSFRNDLFEMFCVRQPHELASDGVFRKISRNIQLLEKCKESLWQITSPSNQAQELQLYCLPGMLCHLLIDSALNLCVTYIRATEQFRHDGDHTAYRRSLFLNQGKMHHADIDFECGCIERGNDAISTSNFIQRCNAAVSHAYNTHSYVELPQAQITNFLLDLVNKIMRSAAALYTPLTIPPDIIDHTMLATECRQCSKDLVTRGTLNLVTSETLCTCAISPYDGTNSSGGMHTHRTIARHILFDATQRIMCMQAPMCGCLTHRKMFKQTLGQFVDVMTDKKIESRI